MALAISEQRVASILPHQPPLRLIHGVTRIDAGSIDAFYRVASDGPLLAAHFPGFPVMPGLLVVEALAQAAAILAAECGDYDPATELVLLMSVESARFRRPVFPPCLLEVAVESLRRGKLWRCKGVATVGPNEVAEAIFVAAIRPRERVAIAE